ncbi:MAG: carbohydrate porin [Mariprofundus sp.]|nr:carbohydrate porin [Mariprofundus sp.]
MRHRYHVGYLLLLFTLVIVAHTAQAEPPGFLGQPGSAQQDATLHGHDIVLPGISGDWGGTRASLEDRGIRIESAYIGEFVRDFSGGTPGGNNAVYQDNLDLTMTLDSKKLGLWRGGTLFIYGLRNHGGDPSANIIGDLQTASNIEAPDQFIVHEAWYEQQFSGGFLSVLVGLHDLNSEFYVSDYGSLFIDSSFGIGPDMSANVSVSLFPKAGLAVRVRVTPTGNSYVQMAIYDGDPSTRSIHSAEGKLMLGEAGFSVGTATYKVGYWNHSADKAFAGQTFGNDYGMYGIIDQEIMHFDVDSTVGAFFQYGWAPAARNAITRYIGGGFHLHGIIPTRDEDDIGIAIARADTHLSTETTLELTYRLVLMPWLTIQPSYQIIRNPGGNSAIHTANVGLLRFEVIL